MAAPQFSTGSYAADGSLAQSYDFYPPRSGTAPAPLVCYVHGGAWRFGDKASLRDPQSAAHCWVDPLLEAGYAVASVNYRFSSQALFPAQLQDLKAALRFFRSRAEAIRIDPQRIALVGGSAGGHLVQLAAATPDSGDPYLEGLENPGHSTDLRCAVSVYGVSDLRTVLEDRLLCGMPRDHAEDDGAERRLMGSSFPAVEGTDAARAWAAGQPVDYQQGLVGRGPLRPVHFVHGTGDGVVPWIQSERAHRALVAAGVDTGLDLVEGAGHGDPAVYRDEAVRRHVFSWLARHLG